MRERERAVQAKGLNTQDACVPRRDECGKHENKSARAHLDWARDERRASAGDRREREALRKVRLAVLCERIAEGLEEAVPRCRVEDLPEATGAEAGVQAGDALALDQIVGERGKGSGRRAAARHDGQVHPDGQRVERVNTDPAQHAAEAGRAYRGLSRASAFSAARVRPEP